MDCPPDRKLKKWPLLRGNWSLLGVRLYLMTSTQENHNRPHSIYQYSSMSPRLSGRTSIFGVVFFVSKSLLGILRQKKLKNLQF